MISLEDRLRIIAALQAEFGNSSMAEILFTVAETRGVEQTLLDFNRILAQGEDRIDEEQSSH